MHLPLSDLLPFPTPTPPHTSTSIFSADFHSSRASLNPTWSPNVKSPSTYLPPPPPRFWLCRQLSALQGEAPQATVQLLQTEVVPPSLTVAHTARRKRMLMDQIRWKLRWEHGAWRRGEGRCKALVIGCHSDSGPVCAIECIGCACLSGWEALAAQDCAPSYWYVFLQSALKFKGRTEGASEGGAGKKARWKDREGYAIHCSVLLFLHLTCVSHLLESPTLSLTLCLPRSQSSPQSRQRIRT